MDRYVNKSVNQYLMTASFSYFPQKSNVTVETRFESVYHTHAR